MVTPTDPLPDAQADALLDRFGAMVAALARQAFARMLDLIGGAGLDARKAAAQALGEFSGAYTDRLAEAFSELLRSRIGPAEVRAMPVGDLTLSTRLYHDARQTALQAQAIVREHAQGVQQARELALSLYDGYGPGDGIRRPLEGSARAELPKALRSLTEDFGARRELTDLMVRGQESAARLKTQALRAAYSEAIDAWKDGAAEAAVRRKLDIAVREKTRYFANRIAQTELARAHQAQKAAELMADDTIDVVQVLINPTHPKTDICDFFGRADLWGLGPGFYPKAQAPVPTFHPFCLCKLRSRPSLSAAMARQVPGGEGAYLRSLPPEEAARVMGSRERAQQVLDGSSVDKVVNAGRDPLYRLRRLGDGVGHALVKSESKPVNDAFEIAKAGGPHCGLIRRFAGESDRQVEKSLQSVEKRIIEHLAKIKDPLSHVEPGTSDVQIAYLVNSYWPKEINTFRREADVLRGILKERKDGK